jgi:hypothetical protein
MEQLREQMMVPQTVLMTVPRWVLLLVTLMAPMTAQQTVLPKALHFEPESLAEEMALVATAMVGGGDRTGGGGDGDGGRGRWRWWWRQRWGVVIGLEVVEMVMEAEAEVVRAVEAKATVARVVAGKAVEWSAVMAVMVVMVV